MEDWIKEIIIGFVLLAIGGITFSIWYKYVIRILLGIIPIVSLFAGILLLWIGFEDKKLEKELKELEKELEKS